jgi:hypothetical protein
VLLGETSGLDAIKQKNWKATGDIFHDLRSINDLSKTYATAYPHWPRSLHPENWKRQRMTIPSDDEYYRSLSKGMENRILSPNVPSFWDDLGTGRRWGGPHKDWSNGRPPSVEDRSDSDQSYYNKLATELPQEMSAKEIKGPSLSGALEEAAKFAEDALSKIKAMISGQSIPGPKIEAPSAPAASPSAAPGKESILRHGGVTVVNHFNGLTDSKRIADAVHDKFVRAAEAHLSDGQYIMA